MKRIILIAIGIVIGFVISTVMYSHLYWDSNNENLMYQEYLCNRFSKEQANKIREYVKFHSTDKFLKSQIKERIK